MLMIYWRKQGAGIFATACVETEFDPSLIYSSLIMIYYYIDVFFWDHPSLNYFCAHVYSFFFFFPGGVFIRFYSLSHVRWWPWTQHYFLPKMGDGTICRISLRVAEKKLNKPWKNMVFHRCSQPKPLSIAPPCSAGRNPSSLRRYGRGAKRGKDGDGSHVRQLGLAHGYIWGFP